ncbi:hypothetical protein [Paramuribaculum intestinale]|uniref:hypothetical protein n=1 Tax=Paramuribaculum intestinale TaxID=2094151 RepID=UPI0013752AE4|nr:hypothetical protein [Paramuribaculum intestinale]MBJ2185895.1 hypothetical protein [Muribaculaceae bacterium]MCX4329527.1 hypothetical protein [Paramuribaculum intestinale]WLT41331.1 hypothetical protein NF347_10135 [Paramuribaculum intestinale]
MKTVLLTMTMVLVAGLLLAVKVLTVRGGRFPSHHQSHQTPRRQGRPTAANATDTVKKS